MQIPPSVIFYPWKFQFREREVFIGFADNSANQEMALKLNRVGNAVVIGNRRRAIAPSSGRGFRSDFL